MDNKKKFLPVIKVGGRRVVKRLNPARESVEKLKKLIEENKKTFTRSAIDELIIEKGSKLYKYKSNIRVVLNSQNTPVGILVSGVPEIRNKMVFDVPDDFESVVDDLNSGVNSPQTKLEEALNID